MPPPNTDPDPNRIRTRPGNANAHPGTTAKDALRVRNPARDPKVIQKEKTDKETGKAAKQKAAEEAQAKEESAIHFVEEYRARKDTEALIEDSAMPRQRPRGEYLNLVL